MSPKTNELNAKTRSAYLEIFPIGSASFLLESFAMKVLLDSEFMFSVQNSDWSWPGVSGSSWSPWLWPIPILVMSESLPIALNASRKVLKV